MLDITVYILTHDRPDIIAETIDSVLNQSIIRSFNLIVSDNSSNNLTEELIKIKYPKKTFRYIKREFIYNGIEHLNVILSEIRSGYLIMFHDDDIMRPTMIETMLDCFYENNNLAAVSCNAYIMNNRVKTQKKILNFKKNILFKRFDEMAFYYMNRKGVPPFPSYMYNMNLIYGEYLNYNDGHKYSDAAFICRLLNKGNVLFLNSPLFYYRIHSSQDSSTLDTIGYSKLYHYFIENSDISSKSKAVKKFRLYHMYWAYILNKEKISEYTYKKILTLLVLNHEFIILLKILIRSSIRK